MACIAARPFTFDFDATTIALIVIDMQRDFAEPGGFGESLGNDVSRITAIVPAVKALIAGFRSAGLPVIHTMECHRPDLSDCPAAKRNRGTPSLRIGDQGPMGRILIAGEPGTAILDEVSPVAGEIVIEKPGKGAFYATDLEQSSKCWESGNWCLRASPRKSACRPPCAKPMTADMTAFLPKMRQKAISRNSSPRPSK